MTDSVPAPHVDPEPQRNPGGVDAVVDDPDDFPLQVADEPGTSPLPGSPA